MRWPRYLLALLLSPLLLAGCPKPPAPGGGAGGPATVDYDPSNDPLVNPETMLEEYDPAQATEADWLMVTLNGNPATLNPIFSSSTYEFMIADLTGDSPFSFDREMNWLLNDKVAESLEVSDDKKVWTVKLKPGLKWHDGHPFTAHDIAFSWREILDDRVPCPAQKSGTDEIELCEAVDDLTVRYVHKNPLPTSKWNVLFSIIPKHIYEKGKEADPTLKTSPYYAKVNRQGIGMGPYRVVEWVENDKIVLERWEDYHGDKPHFAKIVCRIIPDVNVQLLSFEKGDVDEVRLTSKQFALETVGSKAFTKVGHKAIGSQWAFSYIVWNQDGSNPFFNDKRVRHAMTHATNIPLMIDKLEYKLADPCYGIYHPDSWMFNPDIRLLDFDLKKSAALLDEAGWTTNAQTGWREKDGVKFSFTLMIPQGAQTSVDIATIMQQDLKSIGVEMKQLVIEWATFSERNRKHEFQCSIAAWGTGTDPDTGWNIWHSSEYNGGRNYGGFKSDRADELMLLARHEFDEEKRASHYRELQQIVYDDQAYTFLWNRKILWAFNKRIRGVVFSPRGVWNFSPSYTAWWVHKNDQAHGMK